MYKIRYIIDGVVKEITVNAKDAFTAQKIFTNMYGSGNIQIISVRRV